MRFEKAGRSISKYLSFVSRQGTYRYSGTGIIYQERHIKSQSFKVPRLFPGEDQKDQPRGLEFGCGDPRYNVCEYHRSEQGGM